MRSERTGERGPRARDGRDGRDHELTEERDDLVEAPLPIKGRLGSELLPDLHRVPRERWFDVLRPLSERARGMAMAGAPGDPTANLTLLGELIVAGPPPGTRRGDPRSVEPVLPTPRPLVSNRSRLRFLTIRMTDAELDLVHEAAEHTGLRAAQLARAFVLNGSRAVLR